MHQTDEHAGHDSDDEGHNEDGLPWHRTLEIVDEEDAAERAYDHDALQRDVDHAGPLGEQAAQGHYQQGDGEIHHLLDQENNQFTNTH
jgi:hypothetical protein